MYQISNGKLIKHTTVRHWGHRGQWVLRLRRDFKLVEASGRGQGHLPRGRRRHGGRVGGRVCVTRSCRTCTSKYTVKYILGSGKQTAGTMPIKASTIGVRVGWVTGKWNRSDLTGSLKTRKYKFEIIFFSADSHLFRDVLCNCVFPSSLIFKLLN